MNRIPLRPPGSAPAAPDLPRPPEYVLLSYDVERASILVVGPSGWCYGVGIPRAIAVQLELFGWRTVDTGQTRLRVVLRDESDQVPRPGQ